jgi:hypothetical protein
MTLTLWREGREVSHPVSGAPMARLEEQIGSAEVTASEASSSSAVLRKRQKEPQPGDRARITPKRIPIAVIGTSAGGDIVQALRSLLSLSGRFSVLDGEKTDAVLKEQKPGDPVPVRDMGRTFGVDAVISLSASAAGGRSLITAEILYADDGRSFGSVTAAFDQAAKRDVLGDITPYFSPAPGTPDDAPPLPFTATAFAVADLDADGTPEHVFADDRRLHVYRRGPSGWKEVWTEIDVPANPGDALLSMDVADINGNGRPEIFAAVFRNQHPTTLVFEAVDGEYRLVARVPALLRVIRYPGKGPLLVGQDGTQGAVTGAPKLYTWSGAEYAAEGAFAVPKGLGLYGFAVVSSGSGEPLFIALDEGDHLLVYSGEALRWRSAERYAAGRREIRGLADRDRGGRPLTVAGPIAVFDGDGTAEVVVPRNTRSVLLGGSRKAELHVLQWNGERLEERREVNGIPGAVLDLRPGTDSSGKPMVTALVRSSGWFTRDRTRVKAYSLQ